MKLPTAIDLQRTNKIKLSPLPPRNFNFQTGPLMLRSDTRVITCHLSKDSKTVLCNSFISFLCSDTGCRKLPWATRLLSNDGTEDPDGASRRQCWRTTTSLHNAQGMRFAQINAQHAYLWRAWYWKTARRTSPAQLQQNLLLRENGWNFWRKKEGNVWVNIKLATVRRCLQNGSDTCTILPVCEVWSMLYNDRGIFYFLLPLHTW
jgi:hypothetical protein